VPKAGINRQVPFNKSNNICYLSLIYPSFNLAILQTEQSIITLMIPAYQEKFPGEKRVAAGCLKSLKTYQAGAHGRH
jgi:hypothetical protein